MKKIALVLLLIGIVSVAPAYGHKLISHDDSHVSFETALEIPDHRISWAVYENLAANDANYYSFDAKHGESFYISIVVPKLDGLENFSPTLYLVGEGISEYDAAPFETELGIKKYQYLGGFPGREFYEPFGQVTYWDRQEVRGEIVRDGQYFIVVTDENNQSGKYSLAIGTIEDFSGGDFFTILPKAWFDTKLFVNDYTSIGIASLILAAIPAIPVLLVVKRQRRIKHS